MKALEATLCGPFEMKFLGGARLHERPRIPAHLDRLPYLGFDPKIWRMATSHYAMLRQKGATLPWNDIVMVTLALSAGCRVYADDHHFLKMAEFLDLHLYTPGCKGN